MQSRPVRKPESLRPGRATESVREGAEADRAAYLHRVKSLRISARL